MNLYWEQDKVQRLGGKFWRHFNQEKFNGNKIVVCDNIVELWNVEFKLLLSQQFSIEK